MRISRIALFFLLGVALVGHTHSPLRAGEGGDSIFDRSNLQFSRGGNWGRGSSPYIKKGKRNAGHVSIKQSGGLKNKGAGLNRNMAGISDFQLDAYIKHMHQRQIRDLNHSAQRRMERILKNYKKIIKNNEILIKKYNRTIKKYNRVIKKYESVIRSNDRYIKNAFKKRGKSSRKYININKGRYVGPKNGNRKGRVRKKVMMRSVLKNMFRGG